MSKDGAGAMALICFVGIAFILSYVGALHVPVGVVGPAQLSAQIANGGAFKAETVSDPTAVAHAIDDRDTYASFVASPADRA
jgi:hypothetical protein